MQNFLIVRAEKIKTRANLAGSAGHNFRERETLNADPSKLKMNQHAFSKSTEELKAKFEARFKVAEDNAAKSGKKIRSDAVLGIEYLVTASPESFKNGKFNDKQFFKDALKFFQDKHGSENIIGASIHRDESTPHLVIYAVPLDKKGLLNCKNFLGSGEKLRNLQSECHEEFGEKHGLQRGIKNSSAEHIPVREFYKKINSTELPKPKKLPEVEDATFGERIKEAVGIETEHSKAAEALLDMAKEQIHRLAKTNANLDAKLKMAELQKSNYQRAIVENSEFKEKEKMRASNLRELPIIDVLQRLGASINAKDKNNFDTSQGRMSTDGQKFFNHDLGKGGRGAIDLVMHLQQCDYKSAIALLANEFGENAAVASVAAAPADIVKNAIQTTPFRSILPPDVDHNWPNVRKWINETRKIPLKIIDLFRKQGLIRADNRKNAVFVNFDRTGGEIRGMGDFKGYRGTKNLMIFENDENSKKCMILESGNDALAFAGMPKSSGIGKVISTGGDFGQKTIDQLKALQRDGFQLFVGTDNDPSGDAKFKKLQKELGRTIIREKPIGRDWQEDLKKMQNQEKNENLLESHILEDSP